VNVDMVKQAMDRIEALLKEAEGKAFMVGAAIDGTNLTATQVDIGDIQHAVNNARQIAGAVKVLMDEVEA